MLDIANNKESYILETTKVEGKKITFFEKYPKLVGSHHFEKYPKLVGSHHFCVIFA